MNPKEWTTRGELRCVVVEDSEDDTELIARELRRYGYSPRCERVETEDALRAALERGDCHVVLADYAVPGFRGDRALRVVLEHAEEVPCVIVSGAIGEEAAAELIRSGASGFVTKERLGRVGTAVERALATADERRARLAAESALQESEDRYRRLADNAPDVIFRFRIQPRFEAEYLSAAVAELSGYAPEEIYARPDLVFEMVHPADRGLFEARLEPDGDFDEPVTIRVRRRDGDVRWVEYRLKPVAGTDESVLAIEGVARDVTALKEAEAELAHLALHDPLTGLANRELFVDRLGQALARRLRHRATVAVLFVDVDALKGVNDRYGHDVGDRVLVAVGESLRSAVRPSDTVARLGGDEFVVLLPDLPGPDPALRVAERVGRTLAEPTRSRDVAVSASIGIAFAPDVDQGPDDLLRDADRAMYRAKRQGGGRYEVFDSMALDEFSARFDTETALREAFDRDELDLAYQPLVDLRADTVVGLEALVRWNRPGHGTLPAGEFISVAEESGSVDAIDRWVLTHACRQAAEWQERFGGASPQVHVNVSARQVDRSGFVEHVASTLEVCEVEPSMVCLELTEESLGRDAEPALSRMRALDELGVTMVIDDFGRGFSSLALLGQLPIAGLKVGRDFVEELGRDPAEAGVVRAAIALARALSLTVTGEGVELEEQRDALLALGCHRAQGFLFAPPLDARTVELLLARAVSRGGTQRASLHWADLQEDMAR